MRNSGQTIFGERPNTVNVTSIYSRIRVSNLDVAGDLRIHEVFMNELVSSIHCPFSPWLWVILDVQYIHCHVHFATKVMMRIITVDPKWSMWGMFIESTRWIATTYPCICFMKSSDGSVFAMKSRYFLLFQPPESRST